MVALGDRKAAILGGTTGIGLATARLLSTRGADVTVGSRNERHLEDVTTMMGPDVQAIQVDATDTASLQGFFEEIGPFDDLVVTVTRRGGAGAASELAAQDVVDAFAGKPAAHLQAVGSALPSLSASGSVTLVSAGSAQSALPGTALLAAVNGAVEAAVAPLARELAPRRINAVSPGVIETDWWSIMTEDDRRGLFAQFAEQTPVGRNGRAEDVAQAICSLIENDYISGVVLPVDGGLRLT